MNDKNLIKLDNSEDIRSFLEKPTIAIAEFLTGLLASSNLFPSSYILSTGKIVQSAIKGKLFSQLGKEFDKYRKEGRIKEDYFATHKNQISLLELLKFIDGDIPDEEIFNAMKSIFLTGVEKHADKQQEEISYQLLLLCKKLNSMDILILKTCYKVYKGEYGDVNTGINSFGEWVHVVSSKVGYGMPELISYEDDKLVELGLLTTRSYVDKSGIRPAKEFRLTPLSIKLCEHITKF